MRPVRQFIVGDLISGIFDLFLTTYRRSTSIHAHSFLPSRWAAYGCLLIILSSVVVGAVLARMAQAANI